MKEFSKNKKSTSSSTKFIWDPKSTTIFEHVYYNKELDFRSTFKIINDPNQKFFIKQEARKIDR